MDKNTSCSYENVISRKDAIKLACFYLQERLRKGSKTKIIFTHAVHIFNVAKIAEFIARHTSSSTDRLNPDTAYILGLLHDIGRIKDETKTKIPHGLEGFYFLVQKGLKDLAPICLTHNFVSKNINPKDFPVYSSSQICEASAILSGIEYNDYDRLILLADNFSRGSEILSLQERMNKNKKFYNTPLSFEADVYSVRNYFNQKYNIDVEGLVQSLFKNANIKTPLKVSNDNTSIFRFSPTPKTFYPLALASQFVFEK